MGEENVLSWDGKAVLLFKKHFSYPSATAESYDKLPPTKLFVNTTSHELMRCDDTRSRQKNICELVNLFSFLYFSYKDENDLVNL